MALAIGQLPDQPAIDGAEGQLAAFGAGAGAFVVIEHPAQLGAREIGVDDQAGLLLEGVAVAGGLQRLAHRRGAAVLPDQRAAHRLAGLAVPQHGGLALVGDADGADLGAADAGIAQYLVGHGQLRLPDFIGIVLDVPGMRIILPELALGDPHHIAGVIEQDGARAAGALVEGQHVLGLLR
ncbi:hypothetical protein D3C87_1269760 [compost metagenome]